MQNEDPTIFDFVLQKYLESDPPEYWKEDALLYAVSLEHFDACKKLLEIGANVNGNPTYSDTPLTFCLSGFSFGEFQQDIFDLLMEHGADLFVGNPSKESALKMATASNLIDVMERLIEKEPKIVVWSCREGVYGALHTAASHGNVRACQLLVVHGADVNVRDQHGKTPLMLSADRSSEDFTRFLLESVVDMNIRDN
ncbi:ankyrin repeat-containing domain protein [Gorgonomyces haynaldii]|nr:ankyrin repeat-containing domain protein [Gorgonomyces haynaldii]